MSSPPLLRGARVVLRPLVEADAEALHRAHGDEGVHHYWSGPAHVDVEQTRRYIADTLAKDNAHAWAITDADGDVRGRIALFVPRQGVAEIGIILERAAQGRGFGREALQLVCDHGFSALGLHRIFADIDPDNAASLALFERAGFSREGLLRGHWITHLGVRDSVILGKLRAE